MKTAYINGSWVLATYDIDTGPDFIPILNHTGEPVTDPNRVMPDVLPEPVWQWKSEFGWLVIKPGMLHVFEKQEKRQVIILPAPNAPDENGWINAEQLGDEIEIIQIKVGTRGYNIAKQLLEKYDICKKTKK